MEGRPRPLGLRWRRHRGVEFRDRVRRCIELLLDRRGRTGWPIIVLFDAGGPPLLLELRDERAEIDVARIELCHCLRFGRRLGGRLHRFQLRLGFRDRLPFGFGLFHEFGCGADDVKRFRFERPDDRFGVDGGDRIGRRFWHRLGRGLVRRLVRWHVRFVRRRVHRLRRRLAHDAQAGHFGGRLVQPWLDIERR